MNFETLNDNVMLIELSREEMEKLHITYESLNDGNENTQTALKTLLSGINAEKRNVKRIAEKDGEKFFKDRRASCTA